MLNWPSPWTSPIITGFALAYVTPSHQYPTGRTLVASRRQQLIAWARRNGCYILEDDYDCDFRYEGSPLQAVAAMAPDYTIYLGTFSKSLGAGLRLGYMVVPAHLADAARTMKTLLNNGNPWLDQAVLAEMMRSGSYAAHLSRIRPQYRARRDALLAALHRYFGLADVSGEDGGLHIFWQLPPDFPDAATVEAQARRVRVGVYAMASAGAFDGHDTVLSRRGMVLGYAALAPKQIEEGIARLAKVIEDAIPRKTSVSALLRRFADDDAAAASARAGAGHLAPNNRQPPALRARPQTRASSRRQFSPQSAPDIPVVSSIYRYPIKGLSAQPLSRVVLEAGRPFPADRMLVQGNREILTADLDDEDDCARVEEYFHRLVPTLRAAPRLVRSPGLHFMDKPDNVLSLINLATVKSLGEQWGFEINPLRFRANFYIDGARPWEEFEWIGSDLRMGGATFRVDRRNGRCGATNVNPDTGRRDLDIPGSLRAAFGHKDLGVYLVTREGGAVEAGDIVETLRIDGGADLAVAVRAPANGHRRFMCRGCYFVYEEANGLPQNSIPAGTSFADIPSAWRCPDCGTEKTTFRPYVDPNQAKPVLRTRPVPSG
jgi:GntR family transcriptional regulator/MocR family aminotransferase